MDLGYPWSNMPQWMRRACEHSDPDEAAAVVHRLFARKYGETYTSNPKRQIVGNAGAEMSAKSFSLLVKSGMHVLEVTHESCEKLLLLLGEEPRWHVLLKDGPTVAIRWTQSVWWRNTIDTVAFVSPSPKGVRFHVLITDGSKHPETGEVKWSSVMFCSGVFDLLSWRDFKANGGLPGYSNPKENLTDNQFSPRLFVVTLLHATAAFLEKKVVEVNPKKHKSKGRRKAKVKRKRRSRSITHMRLDLNGLSALVERSGRGEDHTSESREPPHNASERKAPKKHDCIEHTRKYWVRHVLPEHEATGESRQGKHGTLYAISRTIKKHERGTRIEANVHKLHQG
jgi:hypothetical protein